MTEPKHPLETFRSAREMSRPELAGLLGVSAPTVHRWESGARKIDTDILPRVVEVTGIPASLLRPDLAELFGAERTQ